MRTLLLLGLIVAACSASTPRPSVPNAPDPHETWQDAALHASPVAPADAQVEDAGAVDAALPSSHDGGIVHQPVPMPLVRIATLNLQNFGPTKASRPDTLRAFADAIRRYDLVAVQEVQDVSGEAPRALLAAIQASEPGFDMLLSDNSGQEPEDRNFRERYAFYFRANVVQPIGAPVLFDDSAADLFNREPYVGKFRAGSFDFVLITIHTSPDQALDEIASLDHVIRWAAATLDPDVIALGDYNASCDYASIDELEALAVRGAPYTWIVTDDADTNVSASTACAYDRIVVSASLAAHFTGRWGIEHPTPWFSDHWPVWAEFAGE